MQRRLYLTAEVTEPIIIIAFFRMIWSRDRVSIEQHQLILLLYF